LVIGFLVVLGETGIFLMNPSAIRFTGNPANLTGACNATAGMFRLVTVNLPKKIDPLFSRKVYELPGIRELYAAPG
jgi:hypothetical protein